MGVPKALLDWHGGTLVRRITGILQRVADPVVVVHAEGQGLPPLVGVERVVDREPDRGPLEGIAAGLRAVAGRCPAVFVSSIDLPLLHPDLVLALATRRGEHGAAVPVATSARSTARICCLRSSSSWPASGCAWACCWKGSTCCGWMRPRFRIPSRSGI
jgi:molybdopterin-guanine dinucleotide biosynthesis protein A